jgi:hypothetical protein
MDHNIMINNNTTIEHEEYDLTINGYFPYAQSIQQPHTCDFAQHGKAHENGIAFICNELRSILIDPGYVALTNWYANHTSPMNHLDVLRPPPQIQFIVKNLPRGCRHQFESALRIPNAQIGPDENNGHAGSKSPTQ